MKMKKYLKKKINSNVKNNVLINNIGEYQKIMPEEDMNQRLRLKKRWNKNLFNWRNKLKWIIE